MTSMEVSKKQKQFLELMSDPQLIEILYGGAAGGASVYGREVQTPYGGKKIEDIEIGDIISDVKGGVAQVIDIPWEGVSEAYRVYFLDGGFTEVSKEHLWKYRRTKERSNKFRLGTTEQLEEELKIYGLAVPLTEPVMFERFSAPCGIDPYVLGVLLGDGTFVLNQRGTIYLRICCPDIEIISRCRARVSGQINYVGDRGRDWNLSFCSKEREAVRLLGLLGTKCNTKFIPERFKYGSVEERTEILRGLLDTDGSVSLTGGVSFSTTSERLAQDVQFVVRSLGGNATIEIDESSVGKTFVVDGRKARHNFPCYKLWIQHKNKADFFTLPRKKARVLPYNGGKGTPCRKITKITPIGKRKARCITTSSDDGLYLTDDFIVTHNSKSYSIGLLITTWAIQYPGIKFFVGRKTLKSLRQSTLATLLGKVFPAMGVSQDDYSMSLQAMELKFKNGSMIIFGELDYLPSDPTYSRLGSLEVDVAIIDEAGEISQMAKDAIRSRVGRGILTSKYGMPGKLVLASNPDVGWLKTEYYDPFIKQGDPSFAKWQIGEVTLNEGRADEIKLPAYRAFLKATVYDNPFLPQSYIDNLKSLPRVLRRKLLDGDWNYADEDNMLFRPGLLEKAIVYDLPKGEGFNKVIGVDVAASGGDRSVYTLIDNGVVTTQKVSSVTANWDKNDQRPLFRLMADELIEFAQRNGFTPKEARNIAIEGNGIGQALITCIKERGWYATEYTATHKSRSENYYQLMLDMDSGTIKLYHEMYGLDELKKELAGHTYSFNNQTPEVCKKDEVKQKIGRSPDLADSIEIACFALHNITDRSGDRFNARRIIF